MNAALTAYQWWMVARNVEHAQTEGADVVLDRLRAGGYHAVADAVATVLRGS